MSPKRLLGALAATCGLVYYAWQLMQGGVPSHALWAFIGAIAVLVGIWLLFSPTDKHEMRRGEREKRQ